MNLPARALGLTLLAAAPILITPAGVAPRPLAPASPGAGVAAQHVAATQRSTAPSGQTAAVLTRNWAGYVHHQPGTGQAAGTWRIPRTTTTTAGFSSTWVGIDGVDSRYLAQVGIEQDVVAGHLTTRAWWEVLTPSLQLPEQPLPLRVGPGDVVTAEVRVDHGQAVMTLHDTTTGATAVHRLAYRGPGRTAEWIQEDVQVGGHISPAPHWAPVTFTQINRNTAPAHLQLGEALDIADQTGQRETVTSAPSRRGDGFTVTRLTAGHWSRH